MKNKFCVPYIRNKSICRTKLVYNRLRVSSVEINISIWNREITPTKVDMGESPES